MSILRSIAVSSLLGISGSILYNNYTKEDNEVLNKRPSFDNVGKFFNKGLIIGIFIGFLLNKK